MYEYFASFSPVATSKGRERLFRNDLRDFLEEINPSHGKNVKIKMKIHRFEKRKRKSIIVSHYFDLNLVEEKGVER